MPSFIAYYLQILLLTVAPMLVFGLAVMLCNRLFCMLVGAESGWPLLLFASGFSTPVRELGHLIFAFVTFHRINDFRLLDLGNEAGELGFVEHDYNRKNPVAVFGNFLFALGPSLLGLFFVLAVILSCFHGIFTPFMGQISDLTETGAGFADYARATIGFFPALFRDASTGVVAKILGCLLIAAVCLGIYVSLDDLKNAVGGMAIYALLVLVFAGATALFDRRLQRILTGGMRLFAVGVTALYLVVLAFAVFMMALGTLFFVIRTLFGLDRRVD